MDCINLIEAFDREIEVLELQEDAMIYAIDQKNEMMDVCRIERYDFSSGEKQTLCVLDYARIYESFQTYHQSAAYFYVINVLQDYHLRLRRFNKKTWEAEGELIIEALGEILGLYILNEQYMLVVDEVVKSPEYMKTWCMSECDGNYMNLCYVYDCYNKKRYPVTDSRMHRLIDGFWLRQTKGEPWMYMVLASDENVEAEVADHGESGLYTISVDVFIESVISHHPLYLECICESDAQRVVRTFENNCKDIAWHIYDVAASTDTVKRLNADGEVETLYTYTLSKDLVYHYDTETYDVYYEADVPEMMTDEMTETEASTSSEVVCLTDHEKSFTYDLKYGTFTGLARKHLFVTSFYKKVLVKDDYEYHECIAVHDQQTGEVQVYDARYSVCGDKLVLLRSFLAV